MDLPIDYAARPLRLDDAPAVAAVIAAQERHDVGTVLVEEADLVADWQRPSYDVSACGLAVLVGEVVVAYAELVGAERYDAAVHPAHRGRGLGSALAGWVRELARSRGDAVVGMPVPQGSDGDRLLASLGYHVRWTSWVLALPAGTEVAPRPLPPGYAVREAHAREHHAAYVVQEEAFGEWSAREREPYDDWAARVTRRPGFRPWQLRVVVDPAGAVVAVAVVLLTETGDGYVDRLATRPDHRGRGLAQALLADAFAAARARGATRSTLSTDSRTGALGLYERVGMAVEQTWVHRAVGL